MPLRPLTIRNGRVRELPLTESLLARGITIALAIPGDYMIYEPSRGGLYVDANTLAMVNFAGFNSLNINNDGSLTYNTNPVWHDGNRDITTFIRTTGNQIITGFLDIIGDLVGTRVQSYDGTYYGSTTLANMGPSGFSGANGTVTLRPDGIGSDVGKLEVTNTQVTHGGTRLLKVGEAVDTTTAQNVGGGKTFTSVITAAGGINSTANVVISGDGSGSARLLRVGANRTADGPSYVDLVSEAGRSDYSIRFYRDSGANGDATITNRGTGAIAFNAANAGTIDLRISGTTRVRVNADGTTTFTGRATFSTAANITADQTLQWVSGSTVVGSVRGASGGSMILAGGGGTIFLRPNDGASGAGQVSITAAGAMIWSATGQAMADTRDSLMSVAKTVSGGTGQAGQWTKFGAIVYSGTGTNHCQLLLAMMQYGTSASTSGAIISIVARPTSNAVITAANLNIEIIAAGNSGITADMLMATTDVDATAGTLTISLWVKKAADFNRPYFYELTRTISSATLVVNYFSDQAWQTALPTGAYGVTTTSKWSSGPNPWPPVAGPALGYLDNPINAQASAYTFQLTDRGYCVAKNTSGAVTYTIPTDATVAFPPGSFINLAATDASASITVAAASGVTLYLAGSRATTGNRTVVAGGLASIMKMSANLWCISGSGIQ